MQSNMTTKEAWFDLVRNSPRAAALLHVLTENLGGNSAVVASRTTLAALMQCSDATAKRAITSLKESGWVQVVQLGGKGGVNAYVVNSQVVWGEKEGAVVDVSFTATVLGTRLEQDEVDDVPLLRIPALYSDENVGGTNE